MEKQCSGGVTCKTNPVNRLSSLWHYHVAMHRLLCLTFALLLAGCVSQPTIDTQHRKSYRIGAQVEAPVGGAMIWQENAEYVTTKEWVGILVSPDGWKRETAPTDNNFREELIYTGRTGNTIGVTYREYRRDLARPAFFQALQYDLAQSAEIVFNRYRLEVLAAGNAAIRFKVLAD